MNIKPLWAKNALLGSVFSAFVSPLQGADPLSYIVQPGDTACEIAELFLVPCAQLIEHNGLGAGHQIFVGQTLQLPGKPPPEAPETPILIIVAHFTFPGSFICVSHLAARTRVHTIKFKNPELVTQPMIKNYCPPLGPRSAAAAAAPTANPSFFNTGPTSGSLGATCVPPFTPTHTTHTRSQYGFGGCMPPPPSLRLRIP